MTAVVLAFFMLLTIVSLYAVERWAPEATDDNQ